MKGSNFPLSVQLALAHHVKPSSQTLQASLLSSVSDAVSVTVLGTITYNVSLFIQAW